MTAVPSSVIICTHYTSFELFIHQWTMSPFQFCEALFRLNIWSLKGGRQKEEWEKYSAAVENETNSWAVMLNISFAAVKAAESQALLTHSAALVTLSSLLYTSAFGCAVATWSWFLYLVTAGWQWQSSILILNIKAEGKHEITPQLFYAI